MSNGTNTNNLNSTIIKISFCWKGNENVSCFLQPSVGETHLNLGCSVWLNCKLMLKCYVTPVRTHSQRTSQKEMWLARVQVNEDISNRKRLTRWIFSTNSNSSHHWRAVNLQRNTDRPNGNGVVWIQGCHVCLVKYIWCFYVSVLTVPVRSFSHK